MYSVEFWLEVFIRYNVIMSLITSITNLINTTVCGVDNNNVTMLLINKTKKRYIITAIVSMLILFTPIAREVVFAYSISNIINVIDKQKLNEGD